MTPAASTIRLWRREPLRFVTDTFNPLLDEWQIDALRSLESIEYNPRRRMFMKAATGVGKSALLSWVGWWRLACFGERGLHPKGLALSGEGRDNLNDGLFAELSVWMNRSEFLRTSFTWTKSQIYANGYEDWFLSARSYPKDANAEQIGQSLSGVHSAFPFILLDEIGGAPPIVGQRAEQIFTGGQKDALIIGAGNPTDTSGLLYAVCNNPGDAKIITISSDPSDPKRSTRVDLEHAKEMIQRYGRDNAWVRSTILGLWPETGINTLLSLDEVEASMARVLREEDYNQAQKRIGVDVARFGLDSTYLAPRQGLRAFNPVEMRNARTNEIAARLVLAKHKWKSEMELVDDTGGFGSGVVDSLLQAGHAPVAVNFSGKAADQKYLNARAEMWFRMAEWVKRGGQLPPIPQFSRQFTTPTYTFVNGKFQLEPKEQIKKRLGFSPDYADALAMTFYHPEMPSQAAMPQVFREHFDAAETEWNPFDESRT